MRATHPDVIFRFVEQQFPGANRTMLNSRLTDQDFFTARIVTIFLLVTEAQLETRRIRKFFPSYSRDDIRELKMLSRKLVRDGSDLMKIVIAIRDKIFLEDMGITSYDVQEPATFIPGAD